MFFCNISAGIAIIGFQSPLIQDLIRQSRPATDAGRLASLGATLIAVTSLFNGLGRFAWAAVSDRIGRVKTFRILVASELAVFAALIVVRDPWVVAGLLCWVLFCYGGGFGTMPAAILEAFGPVKMAAIYGAVLTAWSAAGLAGPPRYLQELRGGPGHRHRIRSQRRAGRGPGRGRRRRHRIMENSRVEVYPVDFCGP